MGVVFVLMYWHSEGKGLHHVFLVGRGRGCSPKPCRRSMGQPLSSKWSLRKMPHVDCDGHRQTILWPPHGHCQNLMGRGKRKKVVWRTGEWASKHKARGSGNRTKRQLSEKAGAPVLCISADQVQPKTPLSLHRSHARRCLPPVNKVLHPTFPELNYGSNLPLGPDLRKVQNRPLGR
jgi:hypothetical protein